MESPGGNVLEDSGPPLLTITYGQSYPVITPTESPEQSDGSVSVDYSVAGTLPQGSSPEVDLYWAPTKNFGSDATATGASVPVEQEHDGPTTFTAADLGTPWAGTQYLLAVADPGHAVTDPDECFTPWPSLTLKMTHRSTRPQSSLG